MLELASIRLGVLMPVIVKRDKVSPTSKEIQSGMAELGKPWPRHRNFWLFSVKINHDKH
ncbi:hypothetical protein AALP_AA3G288500 [Arabis alpina]|uniref:Uncharacterized protein n=1 Tax=Arabis alpina TaxID=50452 RepID=A0A087HCD8_ARAAL|nr:hypothetical protein AALP_AA3G288500 [Arabis alpina]